MRGVETVNEEAETRSGLLRGALLVAAVVFLGARFGLWTVLIVAALVVMIFLHELGHYLTAKWADMEVTEFFLGFGPRIWSFRRAETEYGIKAIPAGAYVKIIGMNNLEEVAPQDEPRAYRSKPFWRRLSVAVAGSTMHFLIAFVLVVVVVMGFGLEVPSTTLSSVTGPAKAVGMQPGDKVVAVDGVKVTGWDQMTTVIHSRGGKTVAIDAVRKGKPVSFTATLERENPQSRAQVGYLGVGPGVTYQRGSVFDAARQMGTAARLTFEGLGRLFSPSGLRGYVDTVTSPSKSASAPENQNRPLSVIGVVEVGSQVAEQGVVNVIYLLFIFNMFIGIFNLFPLLPFDGGHVVIAVYEKIRSMISGRPYHADVTKMLPFTYALLLVLVPLFISVTYLDVFHGISLK